MSDKRDISLPITLPILMQAFNVALIVGSLLLLINQFDAVFGDQSLRWLPALLTYSVPFCVFLLGRSGGK